MLCRPCLQAGARSAWPQKSRGAAGRRPPSCRGPEGPRRLAAGAAQLSWPRRGYWRHRAIARWRFLAFLRVLAFRTQDARLAALLDFLLADFAAAFTYTVGPATVCTVVTSLVMT